MVPSTRLADRRSSSAGPSCTGVEPTDIVFRCRQCWHGSAAATERPVVRCRATRLAGQVSTPPALGARRPTTSARRTSGRHRRRTRAARTLPASEPRPGVSTPSTDVHVPGRQRRRPEARLAEEVVPAPELDQLQVRAATSSPSRSRPRGLPAPGLKAPVEIAQIDHVRAPHAARRRGIDVHVVDEAAGAYQRGQLIDDGLIPATALDEHVTHRGDVGGGCGEARVVGRADLAADVGEPELGRQLLGGRKRVPVLVDCPDPGRNPRRRRWRAVRKSGPRACPVNRSEAACTNPW